MEDRICRRLYDHHEHEWTDGWDSYRCSGQTEDAQLTLWEESA